MAMASDILIVVAIPIVVVVEVDHLFMLCDIYIICFCWQKVFLCLSWRLRFRMLDFRFLDKVWYSGVTCSREFFKDHIIAFDANQVVIACLHT